MKSYILKHQIIYFFIGLFFSIGYGQEIAGHVYDFKTDKPIESASVYFDNTTIGTSTDVKGYFTLKYDKKIGAPLVFSFIGYESVTFNDFNVDEPLKVYLKEKADLLGEVVVTADDGWTRKEKLKEFRKHYLGESENGRDSKIINEKDLILHFDKNRSQLRVSASVPIIIKNPNLKYEILVDLKIFEINYNFVSKNNKRLDVDYVYYLGSNFYKSLQENPSEKTLQKRNEAYLGSVLHFMRSIANQELRKNGYRIYHGYKLVPAQRFISVTSTNNNGAFVKIFGRINLLDNVGNQSSVETYVDEFFIDHFGNHSSPEQVRFGGHLGAARMGDSVPMDYLMLDKNLSK